MTLLQPVYDCIHRLKPHASEDIADVQSQWPQDADTVKNKAVQGSVRSLSKKKKCHFCDGIMS